MNPAMPAMRISVVSHGQSALVQALLNDLAATEGGGDFELLLTLNLPETLPFLPADFPFPVRIVDNIRPKGFGANHNAAFRHGEGAAGFTYFCVLNPDIRLPGPVLESLRHTLEADSGAALAAPLVRNASGALEDSARALPTPAGILAKAWRHALGRPAGKIGPTENPDWVAGMFMLFRAVDFAAAQGFDERFHLYYEDVDICCRLRLAGRGIRLDRKATVIHEARRSSHRDLRYLRWHLASMARFFTSAVFFRCLLCLK